MKTTGMTVLSVFIAVGIGYATPTRATGNDQMQLAACVYTRNEVLESGTLLCHYNCGGRDMTTIVKSPKSCPLSMDL
jgi:hypothetical protein